MKISITFEVNATTRVALLAGLDELLASLPPSVKVEMTETVKTVLYGGLPPADGSQPIERAIAENEPVEGRDGYTH